MSRRVNWKVVAGITMIMLSIAAYAIHYLIFRDAHHIFIYLVGDIAFVFIEVLMVTLIIHHLLNEWEKRSHLQKLNMVIETFFSEVGKHLLVDVSNCDQNLPEVQAVLTGKSDGGELDFKAAFKAVKAYESDIDIAQVDLARLSKFLTGKRAFLVNLLQNPSLLEHESFTNTLMSIFHLAEELAARDLAAMSEDDRAHAKIDIERAYNNLVHQWLCYMQYTQKHYPYFFVFAVRTNPFDEKASRLECGCEGAPVAQPV